MDLELNTPVLKPAMVNTKPVDIQTKKKVLILDTIDHLDSLLEDDFDGLNNKCIFENSPMPNFDRK